MYATISTADVIEVILTGTAVNVSYYSVYASSPGLGIDNGTSVPAGTYQLMPSPSPTTSNQLLGVTIYNASTTNSVSLLVRYNNAPSIQQLYVAVLPPGFTLIYDGGPGPGGGQGWAIYNTAGTKI